MTCRLRWRDPGSNHVSCPTNLPTSPMSPAEPIEPGNIPGEADLTKESSHLKLEIFPSAKNTRHVPRLRSASEIVRTSRSAYPTVSLASGRSTSGTARCGQLVRSEHRGRRAAPLRSARFRALAKTADRHQRGGSSKCCRKGFAKTTKAPIEGFLSLHRRGPKANGLPHLVLGNVPQRFETGPDGLHLGIVRNCGFCRRSLFGGVQASRGRAQIVFQSPFFKQDGKNRLDRGLPRPHVEIATTRRTKSPRAFSPFASCQAVFQPRIGRLGIGRGRATVAEQILRHPRRPDHRAGWGRARPRLLASIVGRHGRDGLPFP